MRTADIRLGGVYYTHVSGERVEVKVWQDQGCRGRRYLVTRTDNGNLLPGKRAASALHASRAGNWAGAFESPEVVS